MRARETEPCCLTGTDHSGSVDVVWQGEHGPWPLVPDHREERQQHLLALTPFFPCFSFFLHPTTLASHFFLLLIHRSRLIPSPTGVFAFSLLVRGVWFPSPQCPFLFLSRSCRRVATKSYPPLSLSARLSFSRSAPSLSFSLLLSSFLGCSLFCHYDRFLPPVLPGFLPFLWLHALHHPLSLSFQDTKRNPLCPRNTPSSTVHLHFSS